MVHSLLGRSVLQSAGGGGEVKVRHDVRGECGRLTRGWDVTTQGFRLTL